MAKIRVTAALIEDLVFGFAEKPVSIVGAAFDGDCVVFEIDGEEVADSDEVRAIVSVETNRAGDRFRKMKFEDINQQ